MGPDDLRVTIGGKNCLKPYSCSLLNISAMSYGSLSSNAIEARWGAKLGKFAHNTGEGGISPYHETHEGDLIWQIGTGYFGCRREDGSFCAKSFEDKARKDNVKMIEIKVSQAQNQDMEEFSQQKKTPLKSLKCASKTIHNYFLSRASQCF